jgi:hypothetical protein
MGLPVGAAHIFYIVFESKKWKQQALEVFEELRNHSFGQKI